MLTRQRTRLRTIVLATVAGFAYPVLFVQAQDLATDCSGAAFRRTPRSEQSKLVARCLAAGEKARQAEAQKAPPAPSPPPPSPVDDCVLGHRADGQQGSTAFLDWDVVERANGALTILVDYRYDGSHGEAWIGAQPLIKGEETRLFGYAPQKAEIGAGQAQVHVSLVDDRSAPLCTDALKVEFYVGMPFHEAVLPYPHCWTKAPKGPTDPLLPRSRPARQNLKARLGH